ncbi:hypothetical protein [Terasakiella pusilla]|uniref:hypothetical protein n=1 Tax=Terasakiella pusilla TaxID=64973 RepID=UPI003AA943BA
MSGIYQDEKAPLWLHIMGGILGAVIVILISWQGYAKYQEYEAKKAIQKMRYEAQIERERAAQQRQLSRERQERLKVEEIRRQENRAKFNSPQCQFWRNHYRNNMNEQNLEKVKEYCPQGPRGTLTID